MLIGEILSETAARVPDKPAIKIGGFSQTYGELEQAANRFAQALIREGYGKGRNIAIYSPNQPDYPAIYFGAARSGAVLAHMSARFSVDELRHVIAGTDIEAIFVFAGLADTLLGIRDDLPGLKRIIVIGGDAPAGTESLADFIGDAPGEAPDVALTDDDAFAITYTGGTTGFPKGVVAGHQSRVIGCLRAEREFGIREDDVFCCSTPLFHIAGLFVWFQTGIRMGNTLVLMPAWDAEEFMRLVEEEGVTASFLIPTQINGIISHPNFSADRLKGWRYGNFGGAPNPVAQMEKMLEVLPDVIWVEQYGQSESGNLTVRPPEFCRAKIASAGRAFKDLEMAIFDAEDKPLPAGEIGELVTRGVHLMTGYYKNPEQTAEVITRDGWIRTGDVGYIDDDGFLFLVDRSKDMIISGGENIYPSEIENALYQHPAVNECAVFGIPDDYWGELPAAHVVLEAGQKAEEQELIDFCLESLARYKRPRMIKIVDELPKTTVGKIQKNVIREYYWAGTERKI
ncbi:MAG: class I adenylate-forming enzyme family protein [Rhodospirillales bacterium]|jgi:acyl-CoA synthetase (AMP-forming)/AMP-acid ligase II|nr:long-chain fatty acid--CoA ligase [Rhodospirillaceae bacterium]MDP6427242.1 class I adenylate-forming enzyme family protein [Rhodospirillales bacterium]MDP6645438.1 class I adenylate-forming enzyme family protein [Rhodospirillales bacterium]MDP6841696.1 class I adenylate-forming enzyme family protein [Rhodospirillales bacterium]